MKKAFLLPFLLALAICLAGCTAAGGDIDSLSPADSSSSPAQSSSPPPADSTPAAESSPESIAPDSGADDPAAEELARLTALLPDVDMSVYYHGLVAECTQDGTTVQLYYFGTAFGAVFGPDNVTRPFYMAVRQTGNDTETFRIEDTFDHQVFAAGMACTMTYAGNTATVTCPELCAVLTLDFAAKTAALDWTQFPFESDTYIYATSKDGAYSIYSHGYWGGGDISYRQFVLRENATGKTKFLGIAGGMYSGTWDVGFMSNGDVYLLRGNDFILYDRSMENLTPIFRLGQNFALGEYIDENINQRYLLAARRDPVAYTYLGLYIEHLYEYDTTGYTLTPDNHVQMKATYKVGMFDTEGRLVKEYDTGVHAIRGLGYANVDMYLTDGDQLHLSVWQKHKDQPFEVGTLNLTTGIYTVEKHTDWG